MRFGKEFHIHLAGIILKNYNPILWNQWKGFVVEMDGGFLDALENGSLYLVSDGSYQRDVDPFVCSLLKITAPGCAMVTCGEVRSCPSGGKRGVEVR